MDRPSISVPLVRFVGIGGHVEPGESWGEAVLREAREEAGLEVSLIAPEATYLLDDDGTVSDISAELDWPDHPSPYFIWSATYGSGPPSQERARHLVTAAFLATVPDDVEPRPLAEMPALLAVGEMHLCRPASEPIPLRDLLADGAHIWESTAVPRSALLIPGGSAQWYAALLIHRASHV